MIRFHHPNGHADVTASIVELLDDAATSLRAAVCFLTRPGASVLLRRPERLQQEGSFLIASIEPPSDLDAFLALHGAAPGHIFIHMGGRTPEAVDVGRSLMHSKVLLAQNESHCRLWVGSHNLTAAALGGGNFEASLELVAEHDSAVVHDAVDHLNACKVTAEPFDPSQMARYRDIQRRRLPMPPWITREQLLVIHAEAEVWPSGVPFTVHLQVTPIDFDMFFIIDRGVRLFLHPKGSIGPRRSTDFSQARLWCGSITGVVRTERHPRNQGLKGRFDNADFFLELPDLERSPRFIPTVDPASEPTSQVVLRMVEEQQPDLELYSTATESPMKAELDAEEPGVDLHTIDPEMTRYFTRESLRDDMLIYRPVHGVKPKYYVAGYDETMRSVPDEKWDGHQRLPDAVSYDLKRPRVPVEPFFFVSKYVIRRMGS